MIDLTGQVFGRLTVASVAGKTAGREFKWNCRCTCGRERVIRGASLRGGITLSCGCLGRERRIAARLTHGLSKHPLFDTWTGMRARCYSVEAADYPRYGGRGIRMCERWRNDFPAFLADVGERPDGCSIDRIDNDGDYEPGNVRWATRAEQQHNTRAAKLSESTAERVRELAKAGATQREIAAAFGVSPSLISRVVNGHRW